MTHFKKKLNAVEKMFCSGICISKKLIWPSNAKVSPVRKMSSVSTSSSNIMNASSAKSSKKVVKKTEESVAVPAPAPVAAPVAAPKAKKQTQPAATPAPVAAPVEVAVPAVEGAPVEEVRLDTEVKAVTSRLLALREMVSELVTEAKRLEKKSTRLQKLADKRRKRKAPVEGEEAKPARVSIFQVPTDISPQLCAFLGRPAGSQESRSNVTKFVTTYVKEHNLKNKHDINPDAKLRALLSVKADEKLTYFNLQKYLNPHYLKKAPVSA
jgi:chromatin remodeling complex protein RSC6